MPTEFLSAFTVATDAQKANVVTLRLMQHYDYQITAGWYQGGHGGRPSQHVVSGKVTLPAGKEDTILDIRLWGNRPE
jgi:hypothetical protein